MTIGRGSMRLGDPESNERQARGKACRCNLGLTPGPH
jgi:hypothetical protein